MEAWGSGSLFQGRWQPHSIVTAHLRLLELASFPPVSVPSMVSPRVRGLEASALSLFAAGEVGVGPGKERGGRLAFSAKKSLRAGSASCRGTADAPWEGLSDPLLSSPSSPDASSVPGSAVGGCCFPCGTPLQQHTFQRGGVGCPALRDGPSSEVRRDRPEGCSMAGQLPWPCW